MITKIELTNFKSHAHTVIEPGRVTALVGPNGAGKSNLIQSIKLLMDNLSQAITAPFSFDNKYLDPSLKMIRENSFQLKICVEGTDQERYWKASLYSSSQEQVYPEYNHSSVKIPAWGFLIKGGIDILEEGIGYDEGFVATPIDVEAPVRFGSQIQSPLLKVGKYKYLKATSSNLSAASYSEEIPPQFTSEGHGLASVISYLKGADEEQFDLILAALQQIVPTIKRVRVKPAKVILKETKTIKYGESVFPVPEERPVTGQALFFDTVSANDLPASSISEGTLLSLGLLTLLYGSTDSKIFLLEDIETGLHPLAQRQLMQTLKNFAEKHDQQIILTSHSPYIIDELAPEDVWVMDMDQDGVSHTKRLSEHPDAGRALGVLTTGELWDAEGENWVIENTAEPVNA